MSKLCIAACAALLALVSVVCAEDNAAEGSQAFPKRQKQPSVKVMEQFDKDGDGKLSTEERKAMREEMRKEREKAFDKDGDGKLSETERAAMDAARKEREKAFDKDGDGKLSLEERKAMHEEMRKGVHGRKGKAAKAQDE